MLRCAEPWDVAQLCKIVRPILCPCRRTEQQRWAQMPPAMLFSCLLHAKRWNPNPIRPPLLLVLTGGGSQRPDARHAHIHVHPGAAAGGGCRSGQAPGPPPAQSGLCLRCPRSSSSSWCCSRQCIGGTNSLGSSRSSRSSSSSSRWRVAAVVPSCRRRQRGIRRLGEWPAGAHTQFPDPRTVRQVPRSRAAPAQPVPGEDAAQLLGINRCLCLCACWARASQLRFPWTTLTCGTMIHCRAQLYRLSPLPPRLLPLSCLP